MDDKEGSWDEWGRHILIELERLEDCRKDHAKVISSNSVDIGMLKIKAGIWGGIAGLIPTIGLLIYYIVKNMK